MRLRSTAVRGVLLLTLLVACEGSRGTDAGIDAAESFRDADAGEADAGVDAGGCDCDDGIACSIDTCDRAECAHVPDHTRCPEGSYCDELEGCVGGEACVESRDCVPSPGGCFARVRCDPATRTCVHSTLDEDRDGDPPPRCGGMDCDDSESTVNSGAVELCDGLDNDCDGAIDSPLAADACPPNRNCVSGRCACDGDWIECNGTCRNRLSDPENCGGCGIACRQDQGCVHGACVCESPIHECSGRCVDFASDRSHCGGCSRACVSGALCSAGLCTCPPGYTECFRVGCVDLSSTTDHCGACSHACLDGASCDAGQCDPRLAWVRPYPRDPPLGSFGAGHLVDFAPSGSVLTVGATSGARFRDPVAGSLLIDSGAGYVVSHGPDGAPQWVRLVTTSAAGSTFDPLDMEVATDGSIYVLVRGQGTFGFPPAGTVVLTPDDLAVVKLSASGSYLWHDVGTASSMGSPSQALALDATTIGVVGWAGGPVTFAGTTRDVGASGQEGFVSLWSTSGGHVSFFRTPGRPIAGELRAGEVWLAGSFSGAAHVGASTLTALGYNDLFFARFSRTGTGIGAFRLGTASGDLLYAVAYLPGGDIVFSSNSSRLVRVTSSGTVLWFDPWPGSPLDRLALDDAGRILELGTSRSRTPSWFARYSPTGTRELEIPVAAALTGIAGRSNRIAVTGYNERSLTLGTERIVDRGLLTLVAETR